MLQLSRVHKSLCPIYLFLLTSLFAYVILHKQLIFQLVSTSSSITISSIVISILIKDKILRPIGNIRIYIYIGGFLYCRDLNVHYYKYELARHSLHDSQPQTIVQTPLRGENCCTAARRYIKPLVQYLCACVLCNVKILNLARQLSNCRTWD